MFGLFWRRESQTASELYLAGPLGGCVMDIWSKVGTYTLIKAMSMSDNQSPGRP
jgi:hypothetical protein